MKTPLIFLRFGFSFSEVLLYRSKSLWKAERIICKLGHLAFSAVERLGLGKLDLKKKTCVIFLSGLILNLFYWYYLSLILSWKTKEYNSPFSAPIPLPSCFFFGAREKQFSGAIDQIVPREPQCLERLKQTKNNLDCSVLRFKRT